MHGVAVAAHRLSRPDVLLATCWPLRQHSVEGERRLRDGGQMRSGRALRFLQEEAQRGHSGAWGRWRGCFRSPSERRWQPSTRKFTRPGGFCRPGATPTSGMALETSEKQSWVGDIYTTNSTTTTTTSSQQTKARQAGGAFRSSEVVFAAADWKHGQRETEMDLCSHDITKERKERLTCRI